LNNCYWLPTVNTVIYFSCYRSLGWVPKNKLWELMKNNYLFSSPNYSRVTSDLAILADNSWELPEQIYAG